MQDPNTEPETRFQQSYRQASDYTRSVIDDLRNSEMPTTLRRDFRETYDFYLDDTQRRELAEMGGFKRSLVSAWYLLKGLFLKLTPTRRLFVLIGVVLLWDGMPSDTLEIIVAFFIVLFVLGLELKDKLLARDELEAGRAVQLALMPSATPIVAGWDIWMHNKPANDVGGDLIDHIRIEDGRTLITLGDVAGKGLPAALMAAKLQATIRAIAPDDASLASVGLKLNEIFCRDGLPSRFASLVHAELGPHSDEVRFINAGHMPPLLVRDGRLEEVGRGGPAIGLSLSARFEAQSLRLGPDDVLLLYSDGVTEARNEVGRFYGDDRFRDLIRHVHGMSAASIGTRVLRSVEEFVRSAPQSDDLSLIVIRRESLT
ncbi:MAG: serine/threonine-protein phosphatase [Rhodothermales bacterium]|nr:serine/threonine-protein phosphatase [Rhodothermales bacterium]